MALFQIALLGVTLFATSLASAQEITPSAADEGARYEKLRAARDMTEAFDNMTPDEIAEVMGFPENMDLLQPVAGGLAAVRITVRISSQRLYVEILDPKTNQYIHDPSYDAIVSTGDTSLGYGTRKGCYMVQWTAKMHYSRKYDLSPMPHSVFYSGGFALHGTGAERRLGTEASHGCVRLHKTMAKRIYDLVESVGRNAQVCVPDEIWAQAPQRRRPRTAQREPRSYYSQRQPAPKGFGLFGLFN